MAISEQQTVYPPPAGKALEAPWGVGVAESVIQKFTDTTQRDVRWPMPVPSGSVCATTADNMLWYHDGGAWYHVAIRERDVDNKMPIAGGTFTGNVGYDANANLWIQSTIHLSSPSSTPTMWFMNSAWGGLCYFQYSGAAMWYCVSASAPHVFTVAGSEKFRVDSSGIRVTSNVKTVGVEWIGGDGGQVRLVDTNHATGDSDVYLAFYGKGTIDAPGTRGGYVGYAGTGYLRLYNEAKNSSNIYTTPYAHAFHLAGGEQARLYSNPAFFLLSKTAISATVTGIELHPAGTVYATRGDLSPGVIVNKEASKSSSYMIEFRNDNVNGGLIHRNGTTAAVVYRTSSDARLKDEIVDLDGQIAVDRVKRLRPVQFRWKADAEGRASERGVPTGDVYTGFLAQELYEVVPGAVLPGEGTEDEHYAWEARMQEHYDAEIAFQQAMDSAQGMDAGETLTPPPPLTPEEMVDPWRPWMAGLTELIPDLTAAVRALINRVEALEAA